MKLIQIYLKPIVKNSSETCIFNRMEGVLLKFKNIFSLAQRQQTAVNRIVYDCQLVLREIVPSFTLSAKQIFIIKIRALCSYVATNDAVGLLCNMSQLLTL